MAVSNNIDEEWKKFMLSKNDNDSDDSDVDDYFNKLFVIQNNIFFVT